MTTTLAPDVDVQTVTKQSTESTVIAVAEFFAGIGLARMGLERPDLGFKVTWANDLDAGKHEMYKGHFKDKVDHYLLRDIRQVAKDLDKAGMPDDVELAWASFPCTDLSLAGARSGLAGTHSSTFWDFTSVIEAMGSARAAGVPKVVVLENVNGFATSHKGADIKAAVERLNGLGYWVDVVTLDARRFVPQSRPRLFLIASKLNRPFADERKNTALRPSWLDQVLDDKDLQTHRTYLPEPPDYLEFGWSNLVDRDVSTDVEWWDAARVEKFKNELSKVNQDRVKELCAMSAVSYRTAYRRTRNGKPAWEIRADDIAGCLRTARGGSSKQAVVRMQKGSPLQVRWMTGREYAKLMGAPGYKLPSRNSQAVMGFGDAVCVDAVSWLAMHYLHPLMSGTLKS